MKNEISRRNFLAKSAAVGALGVVGTGIISSCSSTEGVSKPHVDLAPFLDQAPDGKVIRAGLIGCGGRGNGAARNFLEAGPNLEIVALGDVFEDRINNVRKSLKNFRGIEIADEKCFTGFDAYQKVIESGVDVVLVATPPKFRPLHFEAAVQARKHCFLEKPVAVDPVGARQIIATSKMAEAQGLSVITGTQRRHQRDYVDIHNKVYNGEIGDVVGGAVYWNGGKLWHKNPKADQTEMENMIRNWVNWSWLSGDHIVEQHVHNLDVMNWFADAHPTKAVGFGSRQRRITGDQYDNFSIDFVFDSGIHFHSMCRQINGCKNNVSEFVQGTKGSTNCKSWIRDSNNSEIYKYQYPLNDEGKSTNSVKVSPYVQEHIDWVTSIRTNKPLAEAERTAVATMCAIMGRMSAYSGQEVTWDQMMNSDVVLGPKVFALGDVDINKEVPIPGKSAK